MTIKNEAGLRKEIKDEIIYAYLVASDNYMTWYVDPETGEWYSDEEADGNSVPEAYWRGHDAILLGVCEQNYSDGYEPMVQIAEDEDTSTREMWQLFNSGKLVDKYPDYDWLEIFDEMTADAMQELDERLDSLGFDYLG